MVEMLRAGQRSNTEALAKRCTAAKEYLQCVDMKFIKLTQQYANRTQLLEVLAIRFEYTLYLLQPLQIKQLVENIQMSSN